MATTKKTAKKAVKKTTATPKKVVAKAKKAADQPKKKAAAVKKSAPAATKKAVAAKKTATKATAAKKAAPAKAKKAIVTKKNVAKKVAVKKSVPAKKVAAKAVPTKKSAPASKAKKAVAAKKPAVKAPAVKKAAAKKAVAPKKASPKTAAPKKAEKKTVVKATPVKKTAAPKKVAVKPKKETTKVAAKVTKTSTSKPSPVVEEKKAATGGRLSRRKNKEAEANAPVIARRISTKASKSEKESEHDLVMEEFKPETKSILDGVNENSGPVYRYSDEDLNEFKELILKRLENARKELVYLQGLITRKDEAGTEDTDNRFNHMEDGSGAMEREQLSQLAGRQIQFISHLENALVRIENKTYGICRVTGKLIDKARLRAVPHATLSIEAKMSMKK